MKRGPFEDHGGGPAGKCAFQGCDWFDSDLHFIPAVESMEMRRIVIVEVHSNNDAEEAADLGTAHSVTQRVAYGRQGASKSSVNVAVHASEVSVGIS